MLGVILLTSIATTAQAAVVYGTDDNLNGDLFMGERTFASGNLVASDSSAWEDAVVMWKITESAGVFTYEYTFKNFVLQGPEDKQISHVTFDLTDNAVEDDGAVTDPMIKGPDGFVDLSFDDEQVELGNFDGITGSVKFDVGHELFDNGGDYEGDLVYKFTSNRGPVWGHISIKSGALTGENFAFGDASDMDVNHYIARPNGVKTTIIPTPAALPAGLLMIAALRLRRRRGNN